MVGDSTVRVAYFNFLVALMGSTVKGTPNMLCHGQMFTRIDLTYGINIHEQAFQCVNDFHAVNTPPPKKNEALFVFIFAPLIKCADFTNKPGATLNASVCKHVSGDYSVQVNAVKKYAGLPILSS